jgi:hypothetical protein
MNLHYKVNHNYEALQEKLSPGRMSKAPQCFTGALATGCGARGL